MKQYLDLVKDVLDNGEYTEDRTGTGTYSVFGRQVRYKVSKDAFPIITSKFVLLRNIVGELLWFMSGSTNVEKLRELTFGPNSSGKKTIWDDNYNNQGIQLGYSDGELGPVYGKQWRDFGGVDQLYNVIEQIKNRPDDRRLIVSAWNPTELHKMALPPCHLLYQFKVYNNKISLQWYQRSVDIFLG
ncbi:thymidylate synthase [Pseudomonas phage PspYZU05]|uniref:Thymidylate synthase n=1 Tax=Pseudomonas phage PspYZU05 TaxID=1983556 RepID=A0A2U7NRX1_9CAUD|nr:thymidylate synthase [Pseudomonas phage PspYZU05]ASD51972.1 dTMP thymidylate synthase [Pseudomonas phage PspYZU05]